MEKRRKGRNFLTGIGVLVIVGLLLFAGISMKKGKGELSLSLSSEYYYDMVIGYQEEGENILFGLQKLEKESGKRKELEDKCYQEIESVIQSVNWKETD